VSARRRFLIFGEVIGRRFFQGEAVRYLDLDVRLVRVVNSRQRWLSSLRCERWQGLREAGPQSVSAYRVDRIENGPIQLPG